MSPRALDGVRILVIDDAATILRAAQMYLEGPTLNPTGAVVKTASDGFSAIEQILEFRPTLIFLDVVLPNVDGLTLCRAIKSNPDLKTTRIVMMTAKDGVFDRARGCVAGSDAYMTKPFTREVILEQAGVPRG